MKPVHDPNRQQPLPPVRPPGPNVVRPATAPALSNPTITIPTTNTGHVITAGPTGLHTIKTIAATATRVVPHTSSATLTLVGSGTANIRPATTISGITTSYHVSKVQPTVTSIPRSAVANPMMRNIVTAPVVTHSAPGAPTSFVPGIRALNRPPTSGTPTTIASTWQAGSKASVTTPSKITSLPTFAARAPVTMAARPIVAAGQAIRPELATLRTTKPTGPTDKFIRTPARTTLTFAATPTVQPSGQFTTQSGTPLAHLAVAQMPAGQGTTSTGTALTLQPILMGTTSSAAGTVKATTAGGTGRQTGLHPIGPKVITQPAHGHIITHLSGVGNKPGATVTGTPRVPAPTIQSGTPFTTASAGTPVKLLTQTPGTLLPDMLNQPGATTATIIPSGSVFIQTSQHAVNVTPLERGTVVTSAGYTLPHGYIYETTAGNSGILTATPTHPPMGHAGTSHQLIRTFTPTMTQATMQVQSSGVFQTDDPNRKSAFASNVTASGTLARFNPVPAIDRTPTSQAEGTSADPAGSQLPSSQPTPVSSHSSLSQPVISTSQAGGPPATSTSSQSTLSQPTLITTASAPSTPTSTPSKFSASPRPSILRKREHDGTPSKVQKNLGPVLAALSREMTGNSSPPPSPPIRPDSRDGKDGNGGHSSAGSSTISATSSPGLPDVDNNGSGPPGSNMHIKNEAADVVDAGSNNGTNGDTMSPRKKPRKQQLTGNELQEPPYSEDNVEFSDDKLKKDGTDANHKSSQESHTPGTPSRNASNSSTRRRPSVSLLQTYRTCWKPRNNHFLRPTDVRSREDRRPTVAELSSQKRVVQRAQGWKLHHLSTQMDEMAEREGDMLSKLSEVLEIMENPRPGSENTSKDLNRTNELIRSNIQRSKVVKDQVEECRTQLLRLLDHTNPVVDIIKRNANRRQAKKKY